MNVRLCVSVPYRSTHCSSDCDETFTSCKHARVGFGNKKNVLAGVTGVALQGARTIHPIAMKLSQVVNMPAVILEI